MRRRARRDDVREMPKPNVRPISGVRRWGFFSLLFMLQDHFVERQVEEVAARSHMEHDPSESLHDLYDVRDRPRVLMSIWLVQEG
jgi:hypothetical protein